ncbi:MAG: GGDEF domain-containing protein, partial [Desulfobacterales bacterium]|nr:GGDEF domain-containing protein [Desulfobacterales bacterium]
VNDTYGHQEGDNVLKKIGKTINNFVRKMDFPARYGGEEFAIIMPQADMEQAFRAAERIRKRIAQLEFKGFSVTISIGISQASRNFNTPEKLIHAADTALYEAKDNGKNCVALAAKVG